MCKCQIRCPVSHKTLWATWVATSVIAAVYAALSFRTFAKVNEAYSDAEDADNQTVAVLVAVFAGAIFVIAFAVVSFFLLLGKLLSSTAVGYTYGFVNASALNLAVLCLLCGLVMAAFEDDISTGFSKSAGDAGYDWSDGDTDTFTATYAFAFVSAAAYFCFFLIMFLASFEINARGALLDD